MALRESLAKTDRPLRQTEVSALRLEPLWLQHEDSFRKACQATKDFDFGHGFSNTTHFQDYLKIREELAQGRNLPEGMVPSLFFVGVVEGEIVGRLSIRLRLNTYLHNIGGHIGYGVVPAHRRKGYATEMLRQGLEEAKKRGFRRVLVTCDIDNIGSSRVIEKNGGILENLYASPELRAPKKRYWIAIRDTEA